MRKGDEALWACLGVGTLYNVCVGPGFLNGVNHISPLALSVEESVGRM